MKKNRGFPVSPSDFRRMAIRTLQSKGVGVSTTEIKNIELIRLLCKYLNVTTSGSMSKKRAYKLLTDRMMENKPSINT